MRTTAVGLLYPGHSAQDDYDVLRSRWEDRVRLPLVHTSVGEDAHRVDALLDLGRAERLLVGAEELVRQHRPDAVMWACTSGSFVFGWDGARRQAEQVAQAASLPASSTSLAFVAAARALGLQRVVAAASYPRDVAQRFVDFLGHGGVEVAELSSHGILTAAEVGTLGREQVLALVAGAARGQGAEAVLVPDTAMHTLAWLDDLEEAAGMPVLTANQVTVWEGLRLAAGGVPPDLPGLGSLSGTAVVR
ncbi:maleate cis-trans isomerase family protein [Ornithinimicrobium avium]|uniref:Maleate cis-trans isomerase n=1 Tax=Ornithinimicrobium avium TaxID=2283195 RepID=A0A345NND0_9MICO|nr:maleate cis-trans isomerase [Ornithinimicrobium avium]AXH96538.1 maleate cis-trans isomerase [Ornithinimicrobium avium]